MRKNILIVILVSAGAIFAFNFFLQPALQHARVFQQAVAQESQSQPQNTKGFFETLYELFTGDRKEKTEQENFTFPREIPQLYKPVLDYEEAVVDAVQNASPSVVNIIISKDLPVIEQYFVSPFENFNQFFDPFGQGFQFQIPQYRQKGTERKEVGGGSGFIVSGDGLIVTNRHVVSDEKAEYTVLLNDGRKFTAKVLARHPSDDIAIIKIDASGLTPIKFGDSDTLRLGQTAIAIGNALGEFRNTVSSGVVSGLSRSVQAQDDTGKIVTLSNVIQTDAAINPGNSGGPLLNLKGEAIGVNTALVSGAQSIGFAIPINRVKSALQSVQKSGDIVVPYIGIRYILVNPEVKEKNNLPYDYGAFVISDDPKASAVIPNSPASRAGILPGDLVLEYNGTKIDKDKPLAYLVSQSQVGDTVMLKIWRNGKELEIYVSLEKRPAEK